MRCCESAVCHGALNRVCPTGPAAFVITAGWIFGAAASCWWLIIGSWRDTHKACPCIVSSPMLVMDLLEPKDDGVLCSEIFSVW